MRMDLPGSMLLRFVVVVGCAVAVGGEAVRPEEVSALRAQYAALPSEAAAGPVVVEAVAAAEDKESIFQFAKRSMDEEARRWQTDGYAEWEGPWREPKAAPSDGTPEVSYIGGTHANDHRRLGKRGVVQLRDDDEIARSCYDEMYKYGLCLWDAGFGLGQASFSYSYNDWDDDDSVEACAFILGSPEFSCAMFGNPDWGDDETDDNEKVKKKKKKKNKNKKNDDLPKIDDLIGPITSCATTFFAAFDCQYTARCGVPILCSPMSGAATAGPAALALAAAAVAAWVATY